MKTFNYRPFGSLLLTVKSTILTSLLVFPALSSAGHITFGVGANCDFSNPDINEFYSSSYSTGINSQTGTCIDSRGPYIKASAQGNGSGGVLAGLSTLYYSGMSSTYASSIMAQANVWYYDTLTFNLAGLAFNDEAMVRVSLTLHGTSFASSDDRTLVGASGALRASINGVYGYTSVGMSSGGYFNDNPSVTWDIPIRNGVDAPVYMFLSTKANMVDGWQYGSGRAEADFNSTGGITSFEYFALDGTTPLSGSFTSVEGFTLYDPTVVPVPAAVWLFGSGLLGLAGIARRKKVA